MVNFNSQFPGNDHLPPELRAKIEAALGNGNTINNMDALKSTLNQAMHSHNSTPNPEIGGFSPDLLFALEQNPLGTPDCPLTFSDQLTFEQVESAVFFQQMRIFLIALRDCNGVKATATGNLPRSFVNQMVDVMLDEAGKESVWRYNKVLNEEDFFALHEARIVCKLAGLIGMSKGKFVLRKKSLPLLEPTGAGKLYHTLFTTFYRKYNIGYRSRLSVDWDWMQREISYLLKPLQLSGSRWMKAGDLPVKLLHPMMLERLDGELKDVQFTDALDVLERYFFKPLELWGLLETDRKKEGYSNVLKRIRTTALFDLVVHYES